MNTIETAKMSARGQIIIPKEIRDSIHAKESTIFTMMPLDTDTIIMKRLDKNKLLTEFRSIRSRAVKMASEDISKEIISARKKR